MGGPMNCQIGNDKINIYKYHHNSGNRFSIECVSLVEVFDAFVKKCFSGLLIYYNSLYNLPFDAVGMKIKRRLGLSYLNRDAMFSSDISLSNMPKSSILFLGMLFKVLLSSIPSGSPETYKLIVRDIQSDDELDRLRPLLNRFDNNEVLLLVECNLKNKYPFKIVRDVNFNNYLTSLSMRTALIELLVGFPYYVFLSIISKINVFHFTTRVINDYLRYSSLFTHYKSDYLFTERCIKISPLQRCLFHQSGGKKTLTVQKSLLAADQTSFYYNVDCFFSLGESTAKRALKYGGNIGEIIPTGSIFSYQRLPINYKHDLVDNTHPKYDLVLIGMNVMNNYSRFDTHDSFLDEYYSSISWLDKLKLAHPHMRIAIKHHSSASHDTYEDKIFNNSDVEFIEKDINSYSVAFNSKVVVTYGSTMGYEMLALGKPCLFLDPRCGNIFIDDCGERAEIDRYRCKTYKEFEAMAVQLIESGGKSVDMDMSKICLPADGVFERINEYFDNQ